MSNRARMSWKAKGVECGDLDRKLGRRGIGRTIPRLRARAMMDAISSYRIPESWETVRLGSLVESEKGKKPKRCASERSSSYSLPYINIRAFEEGVIESWADGEGCRMCHESDLLLVWDGARSGLVGKGMSGALGSTLARINLIENQYAFYFLQSKYDQINSRTKGSGTPHVDPDLLWNYEFPVPPFNEQRRIVARIKELFSELDKGIESLRKAREQLKLYRQAVLKHAFEGKLTAQWREENKDQLETPEQLLGRIKKERSARYEQNLGKWKAAVQKWEACERFGKKPARPPKLKELSGLSSAEINTLPLFAEGWSYLRLGWAIDEPKYGTSKKCSYNFEGTGVLRIPNVVLGAVDASDLKGAHFEEEEKRIYALKKGDILMIRSNGSRSIVGQCALVSEKEEKYLFAGYLIRLRSNPAVLNPEYLVLLLSSRLLRTQIERKAKSTSGVNNINSKEIQSLAVPVCGPGEQREVVRQMSASLSAIDSTQVEIRKQLLKVATLRQSILQKAFSGQLVAQDPADEPASMLLERIKAETLAQSSGTERRNKRRRAKAPA